MSPTNIKLERKKSVSFLGRLKKKKSINIARPSSTTAIHWYGPLLDGLANLVTAVISFNGNAQFLHTTKRHKPFPPLKDRLDWAGERCQSNPDSGYSYSKIRSSEIPLKGTRAIRKWLPWPQPKLSFAFSCDFRFTDVSLINPEDSFNPLFRAIFLFCVMDKKTCKLHSCQQVDIISYTISCQQVDIINCTI